MDAVKITDAPCRLVCFVHTSETLGPMKILLCSLLVLFARLAVAEPRVEPLRETDIDYGCGCSFHIPPNQEQRGAVILQWEMGSLANLRADGKLHKLNVTGKSSASAARPERVGDKTCFELFGRGVSAHASCTVANVCKPEDESCEVTINLAKVTVHTPAGTKTLDTWASCGC
jgi:hypothetical protein